MSTDRAEVCASAEPQDMGKQDAQREETHEPGSPGKDTPPPTSSAVPSSPKLSKVDVLLKPAGNAPILKKKKWTVDRHKKISWIAEFIRKCIRTETEDSVFVYVNQSFSPAPDTDIGTLFDCFGSDGKLVIYYCRTQAWG
ncbi:autophagy protein 12-like [Pomacea canaliculata]|uniref:autophagy protein 12-like n=1 Tax=Pomacea canaliculata TaxID=400727 RepID=UPI000D73E5AE|nr:autophagy protein 12-like [Pomacea canaliculata]